MNYCCLCTDLLRPVSVLHTQDTIAIHVILNSIHSCQHHFWVTSISARQPHLVGSCAWHVKITLPYQSPGFCLPSDEEVLSDTMRQFFIYFILANKKLLFPTLNLAHVNTHAETRQLLPQHESTSVRSYFLYSVEYTRRVQKVKIHHV
jgi:hypothetical protein